MSMTTNAVFFLSTRIARSPSTGNSSCELDKGGGTPPPVERCCERLRSTRPDGNSTQKEAALPYSTGCSTRGREVIPRIGVSWSGTALSTMEACRSRSSGQVDRASEDSRRLRQCACVLPDKAWRKASDELFRALLGRRSAITGKSRRSFRRESCACAMSYSERDNEHVHLTTDPPRRPHDIPTKACMNMQCTSPCGNRNQ